MPVALRINPIVPDRLDEWRQLVAELAGPRRIEWAESHRRHGITRQVVSLAESEDGPLSVMLLEASDPEGVDTTMRRSGDDFDVWLVDRFDELLGPALPSSVLFDTRPRRGPWPGLRRMGRTP